MQNVTLVYQDEPQWPDDDRSLRQLTMRQSADGSVRLTSSAVLQDVPVAMTGVDRRPRSRPLPVDFEVEVAGGKATVRATSPIP